MRLNRTTRIQLIAFSIIATVAALVLALGYIRLPAMFGIGRYTVTMELPRSGGLYPRGNVTYRGTQVGKIESVHLTDSGKVAAQLSLNSGISIPSDLQAQVHSKSAIGEQYVELVPRNGTSRPLRDHDVIPLSETTVPPEVDTLLEETNRGLLAIPRDSLKTMIDESYTAFGGLGPELSRIVKGATTIGIDARANLDSLTTLVEHSAPILDSQTQTADAVQRWAANLAVVTGELRDHDKEVGNLLDKGAEAADQARQIIERLQPSLPVILSNLVGIEKTAVVYQNDIEQLLVLVPHAIGTIQAEGQGDLFAGQPLRGGFLNFALNFNLPPPCLTGFLPPQQRRSPANVDAPERPAGNLYCRVPQDSPFQVRGARNIPCETVPGKRAASVAECESDRPYVPLNDGYNWKGDPNATWSGQDIPELPPGAAPSVGITPYDPATGSYVAPDGTVHTQSDLAQNAPRDKTLQGMLIPPSP